jgi:methionyl-tRNA formyltransferase
MKLLFAGTPEFSVPTLAALIAAGHKVAAVYTQPDRPAGRGRKLAASPVKEYALGQGIEVRQPENLKGRAAEIAAFGADAMIVIAYGVLLPPDVLAAPRLGCLNVHASLLPRWRGAAPIARAIEAGDAHTGVTIMQMEAGLDTGPMLLKAETPIHATDTAATLHDRLAALGAEALVKALTRLERGELKPETQDAALACYAKKLRKEEAPLDWNGPVKTLDRKIHAFNPWPVTTTRWNGKVLRVWDAQPSTHAVRGTPGEVLAADAHGVHVRAGDGVLALTRLQAEGGKPLAAADFLNGCRVRSGDRLE